MIRLQKYIADAGIASRRKAEQLIAEGKVRVNGETVREMGVKVDPNYDKVEVGGREIGTNVKKYYIMLNKPAGYITTTNDDRGRNTGMELVRDVHGRIYPVGRLDAETEGLLIMTNDGDFANKVIHPSNNHKKVYIAEVRGLPEPDTLKKFAKGIDIGDYVTAPAKAELLTGTSRVSTVRVTVSEGKKRQVRLMFDAVGHPVIGLKRVQIGDIMLGNLPRGKWRHLRREEIDRLTRGTK